MGYEIAREMGNEHTSPVSFPASPALPPAHVTADDFPRLERDDEKQIAAEQKERREERKEGRILVGFRIINKKRKQESEEMKKFHAMQHRQRSLCLLPANNAFSRIIVQHEKLHTWR